MPRSKNFIAIGDRRYGFHTGSTFQIANRFAASGHRVAWISYFLSPFHFCGTLDRREFEVRLNLWRSGGVWQDGGRVWSYAPFTLFPIVDRPFLRSRWVIDHSDKLTLPRLASVLKDRGFGEAEVLWIDSSRYAFALDRIPHGISIFRPSEDITLIEGVAPTFLDKERELLDRADVVLAHSRVMIESYRKLTSRKIIYFPNAVDFDVFNSAPDDPPAEYQSIPTPRAVCLGGAANPVLFDQDLLASLARRLPDVSFVLLGRVYADVSRLKRLPNVHILGQQPYERIPAFLKSAQAGIIPYRKCVHSERVGGDMLKLFEYMACGLPVVSLDFKEFETFASPVKLARDYGEFADLLRRALEERDSSRYVDFARSNSWTTRFNEFLTILQGRKAQRPSRPPAIVFTTAASRKPRPKVAVVHPRLRVGGGSETCVLWILEALKRDYDLTLITSNKVDFSEFNAFYHTGIETNDVHQVRVPPPILLESQQRFAALRGYRLIRTCQKIAPRFDLMISAYNPMDFGRPGIQYILDPLFNTQMVQMLNPTPKKWTRWFYRDSPFRRAYLRLGERLSAYSPGGIRRNATFVDSDWMGRLTKIALGIEAATLYPPVPDEFAPRPWSERENGFLCVGRIVPEKQIERVLEIVQAVRKVSSDVHLHIVGRVGDEAYARSLVRRCEKIGDWITFETNASAGRKAELLSGHKYGLHGKENEPFGITIAEMVKAGCLVWVPRGGGQVEIVDHPDLTYDGLADGVAKVVAALADERRQDELRAHLAGQAKKFSVERFQNEVRDIVARFLNSDGDVQT